MAYTYLMSILLRNRCDLLSGLMVACLLHVKPISSSASSVHHYKRLLFFQDSQKCDHAANMFSQFRLHFVVSLVSRLLTLRQSVKADMHGYSAGLYLRTTCCASNDVAKLQATQSSIATIQDLFNNYSAFLLCMDKHRFCCNEASTTGKVGAIKSGAHMKQASCQHMQHKLWYHV